MIERTRTEVTRIKSNKGDVILQRDKVGAGGIVERRDIVMFTPSVSVREDNLCLLS